MSLRKIVIEFCPDGGLSGHSPQEAQQARLARELATQIVEGLDILSVHGTHGIREWLMWAENRVRILEGRLKEVDRVQLTSNPPVGILGELADRQTD